MHYRTSSCPPPPTKNVLTPDERVRLVRSNKKIQALLGETPHFVENPIPAFDIILQHRRTAVSDDQRIYEASRMRATRSPPCIVQQPTLTLRHKSKHSMSTPPVSRPFLLLRVESRQPTPSRHEHGQTRSMPQPLDTALNLGPPFSYSVAQSRPLPSPPANESVAWKKMDKVTRTLGQAIPPELVLSPDHIPTHA
ncbi:hypothetical protein C8R44DRAFT_872753 [Mycena epipterygia]|nr:hypothetical protein C8R44DRAFT_872753 [Mycena epipterygia]